MILAKIHFKCFNASYSGSKVGVVRWIYHKSRWVNVQQTGITFDVVLF
jgi:hypothetical protein